MALKDATPFVYMDWKDYRESFSIHSHRVLGRRLRPFCLAHQFYLTVLSSPLLVAESISLPQLEQAVVVCSSRPHEIEDRLSKIGRSTTLSHAKWWWRLWRYDFAKELKKFDAYLGDIFAPPEVKSTGSTVKRLDKGGTGQRLPDELSMACAMIKHTGWAEDDVWEMPLGKLHWYSAGFQSLENADFKLVTEEDKQHLAMIKKLKADGVIKEGKL